MRVSFVTPVAALVGLVGLVALLASAVAELRGRDLATALGLSPRPLRSTLVVPLALALASALLALAAAQPVAHARRAIEGRVDAEVLVVFDVSRSMSARTAPDAPSRLARAKRLAQNLHGELNGTPVGIASLTDRVLPHLFPTLSENSFAAVLEHTVRVDQPPPAIAAGSGLATDLDALSALASGRFFPREAKRRVAVVLTDGETLPVDVTTLSRALRRARIVAVFVHVWAPGERVYEVDGAIHPDYRPDPSSARVLRTVAAPLRARVFAETDADAALRAIRGILGGGETGERGRELRSVELAPYAVLASILPLLVVLRRRNLG